MGTSTNAILFFGFSFCDKDAGDELPESFYDDEGDEVCTENLWRVLSGNQRSKPPCEIDFHCHHEYPIYFVHLRDKKYTAYRGSEEQIDLTDLTVDEEELAAMRAYCELMGITWQEPKWILASYWG